MAAVLHVQNASKRDLSLLWRVSQEQAPEGGFPRRARKANGASCAIWQLGHPLTWSASTRRAPVSFLFSSRNDRFGVGPHELVFLRREPLVNSREARQYIKSRCFREAASAVCLSGHIKQDGKPPFGTPRTR